MGNLGRDSANDLENISYAVRRQNDKPIGVLGSVFHSQARAEPGAYCAFTTCGRSLDHGFVSMSVPLSAGHRQAKHSNSKAPV